LSRLVGSLKIDVRNDEKVLISLNYLYA